MGAISISESARLVTLEKVIQRGLSNFIEVGEALMEIRDKKLWEIEYKSFEYYCHKKWGMGQWYAYKTIAAAAAVRNLDHGPIKPTTERQTRPLTKLDSPADQREAWTEAVETSGGKPTAKHVEAAVESIKARDGAKERDEKYEPSNGLQYAEMAITSLEKIHPKDKQRSAAFKKVTRWISAHQ